MDNPIPARNRALLKGRRVLLVEDDIVLSMCLEDQLLEAGAEIVGCASAVGEALRIIERAAGREGIDVAVLDIHLDGHSVLPVADVLSRRGVPFLFSAGQGRGCNTGRHGAAPILRQPYQVRQLIQTIEALCHAAECRLPR